MELRSSKVDAKSEIAKYSTVQLISSLLFLVLLGLITRNYAVEKIGLFFFMTACSYLLVQFPSGYGKAIQKRISERNGAYIAYYVLSMASLTSFGFLLTSLATVLQFTIIPFTIGDIIITTEIVWAIVLGTVGMGGRVLSSNFFSGLTKFFTGELYYLLINRIFVLILVYWLVTYYSISIISLFIIIRLLEGVRQFIVPLYAARLSDYREIIPSREQIAEVNQFAKWSIPVDILNDFYHRTDTVFIAYFLTAAIVGYYESSLRIVTLAGVITSGVRKVITVKVSGFNEEGIDYTELVQKTLVAVIGIMGILLVIVIIFGRNILGFVYGASYTTDTAFLLAVGLMIQQGLLSVRTVFESVFNGLDMPKFNFKVTAGTIAVNLAFAPILIIKLGAVGMVLATIIADTTRAAVFYYFYRKKTK